MPSPVAMQPWDETPMRRRLVEVLHGLPRTRLDLLLEPGPGAEELTSGPAVYLQFFATPVVEPVLGPLVATGVVPAYIGSAYEMRSRAARYRNSISGMASIHEQDIHIAVMPCSSVASALFAESAAISELPPAVMQGMGWGSQRPGSNRAERSPADALFPGRGGASPPSLLAQADARLRVVNRLIALVPGGPRWAPLF